LTYAVKTYNVKVKKTAEKAEPKAKAEAKKEKK
jgi:hypothetical protein